MSSRVILAFELLGALTLFLYSMRILARSLRLAAGDGLRALLRRATTNRFAGVGSGVAATALLQSSSATTVMLVGLVGAGLLTLTESIGVIMGANIGTTLTGWLVAVVGFKLKITAVALPIIALGGVWFAAASLVRPENRPRNLAGAEAVIALGTLFLALGFIKGAVPDLDASELSWVASWAEHGWLSSLLFVFLGGALTLVLQSSSATMALTMTMAVGGWMSWDLAAAMVLGENIGTTATANIAAVGGSVDARRAARAHLIFNAGGAIWALLLLSLVLLPAVDALVPGDPSGGSSAVLAAHLAAFHTLFNIANTALMLPFVERIAALTRWWVSDAKVGRNLESSGLDVGAIAKTSMGAGRIS